MMVGADDLHQVDAGDLGSDLPPRVSQAVGRGGDRRLLPGLQPHGVGHGLVCDHTGQHARRYEEKYREKADQGGDSPTDGTGMDSRSPWKPI